MPGAARRRRCADAEIGTGVRLRIQWPASSDHPRCCENATYVPGPGRCEPPGGRRRRNNAPGCGARSQGVRGSLADRIRGGRKKKLRDHARRNFGVLNGLGRGLGAVTALLFGLGMLGFDAVVSTAFSLAASILPAADLPQAFRVLAVALVPASWLVLAPASFAKASPRTRSPRSGQTAVSVSTVEGAHGSCNSQGKSSGRMLPHSPRALSKLEQDAYPPVYRLLDNKTERQTVSFDALGTRTLSAAHRTIDFSGTRHRDKRSHRSAGNKTPERCPPNDRKRCRIRDRSQCKSSSAIRSG